MAINKVCKKWMNSIQLSGLHSYDEAIERCPIGWHIANDEEWKELNKNTTLRTRSTMPTASRCVVSKIKMILYIQHMK